MRASRHDEKGVIMRSRVPILPTALICLFLCLGLGCTTGIDGADAGNGSAERDADGAFHGLAECPSVDRTIDLSLVQEAGDNDVDGRIFIETNVRPLPGGCLRASVSANCLNEPRGVAST